MLCGYVKLHQEEQRHVSNNNNYYYYNKNMENYMKNENKNIDNKKATR